MQCKSASLQLLMKAFSNQTIWMIVFFCLNGWPSFIFLKASFSSDWEIKLTAKHISFTRFGFTRNSLKALTNASAVPFRMIGLLVFPHDLPSQDFFLLSSSLSLGSRFPIFLVACPTILERLMLKVLLYLCIWNVWMKWYHL